MQLELPHEFESLVDQLVGEGRYACRADVVAAALRLLEENEWVRRRRIDELRPELQRGVDELDSGLGREFTPDDLDAVKREVRDRHAKEHRKGVA